MYVYTDVSKTIYKKILYKILSDKYFFIFEYAETYFFLKVTF